jgi:hypothetical protein
MESICKACWSLGLIAFSFESSGFLVGKDGRGRYDHRSWTVAKEFVAATEELLEILEAIDSSPYNPMDELPSGFEQAAEDCATTIDTMRKDMGKGVDMRLGLTLRLNIHELGPRISIIRSYAERLGPYMKSLTKYVQLVDISHT